MTVTDVLEKYSGRRVCDLTHLECRDIIKAYGDVTNELNAGHDPEDDEVWQAVLKDNLDLSHDDDLI